MSFEPIPSLDYRYEIDEHGTVRNAKTRHVLKKIVRPGNSTLYRFHCRGKIFTRTVTSLLHEVHGILPKHGSKAPIGTLIRKGYQAYCFESLLQTAKFLAKKTFYAVVTVRVFLRKRYAEICGWKIYYREPEQRKPVTASQANSGYQLTRHKGLKYKKHTTSDKI